MADFVSNRTPTIRDVAAEAEVSTSTVSLYIRGDARVRDETGQRIADAIEKLNYVSRPRSPRSRSSNKPVSKTFGFLVERLPVPAFSDIFYGEIIHGMETAARQNGHSLSFSIIDAIDANNGDLPPMVTEKHVAGVLILGGSPANNGLAKRLHAQKIPLVLVDNYIPTLQVTAVVPDNEWGAYTAFSHLVEHGHKRIAIIEGPRKYQTLTDRLNGALRAAADYGVTIPPEYLQTAISSGRLRKGYHEMKQLLALPRRPTAVFATSDKAAVGAYEAIREAGLSIPGDISVVGFDNAVETEPPLTTVNIPKFELGAIAMRQMIRLVEDASTVPTRTTIYAELKVRASTRPVNGVR